MNDKLGRVRAFRDDLGCWRRCQRVIGEPLHFINTQGIFQGACEQLKVQLDKLRQTNWQSCDRSNGLADQLIAFVLESEKQLSEGERGWLSTEILESSFGLRKALEGQHSKGGFTSLLAAFPALLTDCTPSQMRQSMKQVSTVSLKQWVREHLGTTLASKRNEAYKEVANYLNG